jgi:hypothetical protein
VNIDRVGTKLPFVVIHLTGWIIFAVLSWYFTLQLCPLPEKNTVLVVSTALLLVLFYVNYWIFIPRISNTLQLLFYSLIVVAVLILYFRLPSLLSSFPEPGRGPGSNADFRPGLHFPRGEFHRLMNEYSRVRLLLFALIYVFSTSAGVLQLVNRHRNRQQQAEHDKDKAQLKLLTSQVNPHFLFNTLNAIYYLAASKSDKAPDAVLQLSDIMRYTLNESQTDYVSLDQEMDFVRKYVALQQLRLTEKTAIDLILPQYTEGISIAPLLLIPYIENCFKYGISAHSPSTISIKISVTGQRELRAVFSNQIFGQGQGGGFGMQTAALRLNGIYPNNHQLDIHQTDSLFTVLIMIKL